MFSDKVRFCTTCQYAVEGEPVLVWISYTKAQPDEYGLFCPNCDTRLD